MIFQDPMSSLNPLMKIGDQIAEPLRVHLDMTRRRRPRRPSGCSRDVRIPEAARRLEQYPHEMSGGMRQRVMIAIALACGPTLLFADEPTTALDVTVQSQILDLIGEQRRERNMSVILVTHDLGVVAGRTDEIAVMYGGKLVEKAPTATLFANMKMPYTEALFESIPKLEDPSHSRLRTIPGRPPDLVNPPPGCPFAPRCAYARDRCHDEPPPLVPADDPGAPLRLLVPGRLAGVPRAAQGARSEEIARQRWPSRRPRSGGNGQGPPARRRRRRAARRGSRRRVPRRPHGPGRQRRVRASASTSARARHSASSASPAAARAPPAGRSCSSRGRRRARCASRATS